MINCDPSNVGDCSRLWGYILDNGYDIYFEYPHFPILCSMLGDLMMFAIGTRL